MAPDPLPLVTVMIPVYNGARYLGETITSVLDQTHKNIQTIVVDDGSDDGTREVAESFVPQIEFIHQKRSGIGTARNRALKRAKGDYLSFIDADDLFVQDALAKTLAAFEQDGSLDIVAFHVREFVSPDIDESAAKRLRPTLERVAGRLPNTSVVTRKAFERVGGFSTELSVGVSVDWFARANDLDLRFALLPDVLLERRLHDQNNGLRESASRGELAHVLKASLDRRRRKPRGVLPELLNDVPLDGRAHGTETGPELDL